MSDSISTGDTEEDLIKLELSISFDDESEADNIFKALKVDDDEFIVTSREGSTVKAVVRARNVDSARRAADDWLACLMSIKG